MLHLTPDESNVIPTKYIRTGHLDSKFGFDLHQLEFTFHDQQPSLNCVGLHAHTGSQIFERQPPYRIQGWF